MAFGIETFTASSRAEQNVFLPGALNSTWTGATWTADKAATIMPIKFQAKTAPGGLHYQLRGRQCDGAISDAVRVCYVSRQPCGKNRPFTASDLNAAENRWKKRQGTESQQ